MFENRKARLAKIKKGPGVFVYLGGQYDTEMIPTQLYAGRGMPVLDDNGLPVFDKSGRPLINRGGTPQFDQRGAPMLGGPPKVKRTEMETVAYSGVKFPRGKKVRVDNENLAIKLRCLKVMEEVNGTPGHADITGEPALDELTKAQLLAMAKEKGLDVTAAQSKGEILQALAG